MQVKVDSYKEQSTKEEFQEEGPANVLMRNIEYGQQVILHTVQKILTDDYFHQLTFCFNLRKQDGSGYYTNMFLKGNLKPDVLFEIVLANEWNETFKSMEVPKNMAFKLQLGQHPDGKSPAITYSTDRKAFYEEATVSTEELKRGMSEQIYFVLAPHGGIFIQGQKDKRLVSQYGQVGSDINLRKYWTQNYLAWVDSNSFNVVGRQYMKDKANTWVL